MVVVFKKKVIERKKRREPRGTPHLGGSLFQKEEEHRTPQGL